MTYQGFKAWVKLIVMILIIGAVLLVVGKNWRQTTDIWFFHWFADVPVLWLIVVTAVVTIAAWKIAGGIRGAVRHIRAGRKAEPAKGNG